MIVVVESANNLNGIVVLSNLYLYLVNVAVQNVVFNNDIHAFQLVVTFISAQVASLIQLVVVDVRFVGILTANFAVTTVLVFRIRANYAIPIGADANKMFAALVIANSRARFDGDNQQTATIGNVYANNFAKIVFDGDVASSVATESVANRCGKGDVQGVEAVVVEFHVEGYHQTASKHFVFDHFRIGICRNFDIANELFGSKVANFKLQIGNLFQLTYTTNLRHKCNKVEHVVTGFVGRVTPSVVAKFHKAISCGQLDAFGIDAGIKEVVVATENKFHKVDSFRLESCAKFQTAFVAPNFDEFYVFIEEVCTNKRHFLVVCFVGCGGI